MENTKLCRLPRLFIGAIVLLFVGVIYAWSILKYPFEAMWEAGLLGFNFTLTIIFFCLGGLASGLISKKVSSKLRLIAGAVLLFLGFFLASFVIDGGGASIIPLYLAYGVLCGFGIGIVYNTVLSTVNMWFPDKMGLSSGVLMAGFGLSSMILGNLINIMGNSQAVGWQNTYIIIAVVLGIVLLAASFVIKPPSAEAVLQNRPIYHLQNNPPKYQETKGDCGSGAAMTKSAKIDYSAGEMIRRASFVKLFIVIFTLSAFGNATVSVARDIALDVGATPGFAVTAVGFLALANGLGRPFVGWFYDNLGMRKTQYIVSFSLVAAPLMIVFALMTDSLVLGIVSLCISGFVFCMAPLTGSVFVTKFYGAKNFSLNFGIINLSLIPAPFAATMAGVLKDSTGEFVIAFIILAAVSLIGAIVNLTIKHP